MNSAVLLEGVSKIYRRGRKAHQALRAVDLMLKPGEVVAVTGPNGSGKTTILKIVATLVRPSGGRATVMGCDVVKQPRRVRALASISPSTDRSFYLRLTARQNLIFFARLKGLFGRALSRELRSLSEELDITGLLPVPVRNLSSGALRKLSVARAVLGCPRVLLLDEPTASVDRRGRELIWGLIASRARAGCAVLVATHACGEAEAACDRVVVVRDGRLVG